MTAATRDHRTKLYLAGPMRGYDLWNFPAFDEAAGRLRARGYSVISPAELDRCEGFDERTTTLPDGFVATALRRDVEALLKVDAIALLPGWPRSTGARFELTVARAIGLDVFEVLTVLPDRADRDPYTVLSPLSAEAEANAISIADAVPDVLEVDPDSVEIEQRIAPFDHAVAGCTGRRIDRHRAEVERWWRDGGKWPTSPVDPELKRLLAEEAEIEARYTKVDTSTFGEVRVVDVTGGAKGSKLARFDMIPPDVLHELAEHYGHGEAKYPSNPETGEANWQLGYRWSLSAAALMRHLFAWLDGERTDPELGDSHLIAVAWHAFALRWFELHGRGTDDLQGHREPPSLEDVLRRVVGA